MSRIFDTLSEEYQSLQKSALKLNEMAIEHRKMALYVVGETYFDYKSGLFWTTIIYEKWDGSFQALYPAEWERIVTGDFSDLEGIFNRQEELLAEDITW